MSTTSTSSSTPSTEASAVVDLTDDESEALVNHDYVALSEMGAHFFLSLTLFIAVYAEIWTRDRGPLAFQRDFASRVQHWLGGPYPSIAT